MTLNKRKKKLDVTSEFICWSILKSSSITAAEDFRKGSRRDRFVLWCYATSAGTENNRFRLALLLLQKVKKPSRLLLNGDRKSDGWQPLTAVSAATSQRGLILLASCAELECWERRRSVTANLRSLEHVTKPEGTAGRASPRSQN